MHPIVQLAANVVADRAPANALDDALRGHVGTPKLVPAVRALLEFACFLSQRTDTKPLADRVIDALRPLRRAVLNAQSQDEDGIGVDARTELRALLGGADRSAPISADGPSRRWWER